MPLILPLFDLISINQSPPSDGTCLAVPSGRLRKRLAGGAPPGAPRRGRFGGGAPGALRSTVLGVPGSPAVAVLPSSSHTRKLLNQWLTVVLV